MDKQGIKMPMIRVNSKVFRILETEKTRFNAKSYNDLFGKMVRDNRVDAIAVGLSKKERKGMEKLLEGGL